MFKPLLAAKADMDKLSFPMIASPKIDGIRCLIDHQRGAVSRTFKPIPNDYVRECLNEYLFDIAGLDGELVTYTDGVLDDFNTIQSKIMSVDGEPTFLFHVFDDFTTPSLPYTERISTLYERTRAFPYGGPVPTETVLDMGELARLEKQYVEEENWEGVMLRRPDGPYKYGRSTVNEAILLKVKRFEDAEAVIVGAVELMRNNNPATINALGHTERASNKENLSPAGTLGALMLDWNGARFEVGTGFDTATRQRLWDNREAIVGKLATFKFQGVGSQGAPRFPVFLGIRFDLEHSAGAVAREIGKEVAASPFPKQALWWKYRHDFANMAPDTLEAEIERSTRQLEEAEEFLEAVQAWRADGSPMPEGDGWDK